MSNSAEKTHKVAVIHGPNLNLLGKREPSIYGTQTLEFINQEIQKEAEILNLEVSCSQHNCEGEIIDKIHYIYNENYSGLIINPAGYTHTSVAIRDAIASVRFPVIEVHLSNIHKREEFRHKSLIAPVCLGQISGLGHISYLVALDAIAFKIKSKEIVHKI